MASTTTTKSDSIRSWFIPLIVSLLVTAVTAFLTLGSSMERVDRNSKDIQALQQNSVTKEQFTETKDNVREIKSDVKDIQKDIKDILKKGDK